MPVHDVPSACDKVEEPIVRPLAHRSRVTMPRGRNEKVGRIQTVSSAGGAVATGTQSGIKNGAIGLLQTRWGYRLGIVPSVFDSFSSTSRKVDSKPPAQGCGQVDGRHDRRRIRGQWVQNLGVNGDHAQSRADASQIGTKPPAPASDGVAPKTRQAALQEAFDLSVLKLGLTLNGRIANNFLRRPVIAAATR